VLFAGHAATAEPQVFEQPPRFEIAAHFEERDTGPAITGVINPYSKAFQPHEIICNFAVRDSSGDFVIAGKFRTSAYNESIGIMELWSVDGSRATIDYKNLGTYHGPERDPYPQMPIGYVAGARVVKKSVIEACETAQLKL
jgi:hypothetical protein